MNRYTSDRALVNRGELFVKLMWFSRDIFVGRTGKRVRRTVVSKVRDDNNSVDDHGRLSCDGGGLTCPDWALKTPGVSDGPHYGWVGYETGTFDKWEKGT